MTQVWYETLSIPLVSFDIVLNLSTKDLGLGSLERWKCISHLFTSFYLLCLFLGINMLRIIMQNHFLWLAVLEDVFISNNQSVDFTWFFKRSSSLAAFSVSVTSPLSIL